MFRSQITHQFLRRTYAIRTPSVQPRYMSTTPIARFPRKDSQDKDSIKTDSNEYSKSGSDDAAASTDAAFDSSTTSPEGAEKKAEGEAGGNNPLNVSPGNPEVSKPRGDKGSGSEESPKERSGSGKGSAPKSGGGKSG